MDPDTPFRTSAPFYTPLLLVRHSVLFAVLQRIFRHGKRVNRRMVTASNNQEELGNEPHVASQDFSTSTITNSMKHHQHINSHMCIAPTTVGIEDFFALASCFGLETTVSRWCFKGVPGWIAFELSSSAMRHGSRVSRAKSTPHHKRPETSHAFSFLSSSLRHSPYSFTKSNSQHHCPLTHSFFHHSNQESLSPLPSSSFSSSSSFVKHQTQHTVHLPNANTHDNDPKHPSFHRLSNDYMHVYYMNKVVPGGARFWDDSGVCWITRRYLLRIHPTTGSVVLTKEFSSPYSGTVVLTSRETRMRHTPLAGCGAPTTHDPFSATRPSHKDTTSKNIPSTKALRLNELVSSERLCDMIPQKNMLTAIMGALRCIRIARVSALHNMGYRTAADSHDSSSLVKNVKKCVQRTFHLLSSAYTYVSSFKPKRLYQRRCGKVNPNSMIHHTAPVSHDQCSGARHASRTIRHSSMNASFVSPRSKPVSTLRHHLPTSMWLHRLRQYHHEDDIFKEFGYNSVILSFREKELPLVVVFDEISDADQFNHFIALLHTWRTA